jgi:hypothetical protein
VRSLPRRWTATTLTEERQWVTCGRT